MRIKPMLLLPNEFHFVIWISLTFWIHFVIELWFSRSLLLESIRASACYVLITLTIDRFFFFFWETIDRYGSASSNLFFFWESASSNLNVHTHTHTHIYIYIIFFLFGYMPYLYLWRVFIFTYSVTISKYLHSR